MKLFAVALALLLATFAVAQEPRKIGPDLYPPKLIQKTEPAYTEEARDAKLEGTVMLTLTIDAEGAPKDVSVAKALGLGLDEKAMEAVMAWKFEPARQKKDNAPIAVRAQVEVNFRLQ